MIKALLEEKNGETSVPVTGFVGFEGADFGIGKECDF
jgi:hypothetical protein